jgi:hypothetical protein
MSIVEFIKKTFVYKLYNRKSIEKAKEVQKIRNQYFLQEGEDILSNFSSALNEKKIMFWLEFGSLLGYYREHDFIKHDCDIDFGAYLEDSGLIRSALEDKGFILLHQYRSSDGGLEECYKYKHTTIDIFYFRQDEDLLYCNTFVLEDFYVKRWFKKELKCTVKRISIPRNGFVSTSYKGCAVNVPVNVEQHLQMHYGKSFMIPNPNFNYKKEATNIIYYDYKDVKGYMRVYSEY